MLKEFIDLNIKVAENRLKDKYIFDENSFFNENRLIHAIGVRQSGATTTIAKMFNPETDIYVGHSLACNHHFKSLMGFISKPICFNQFKSYDPQWTTCRGVITPDKVQRIYIDVGNAAINEYHSVYLRILDDVKKMFPIAFVIVT